MATNKKKAGHAAPTAATIPFPTKENTVMFGTLLKERRKKAGIPQKEFADMMHVTRNTIVNWEADKSKPDYSYIPELCSLLDIQLNELFQMQPGESLTEVEKRLVGNFRQLSPTSRRVVDKMVSTMLQEEALAIERNMKNTFAIFPQRPGTLAAGYGNETPEEPPKMVFLRKNHINAKADGIALIDGDSMEPVYHSGDYVYYEEVSTADPGEDVLVDTDEGAVIKRVDTDHTLYSVNPAIPYPKKNEQNTLVIRGRVLGVVPSSDRPSHDDESLLNELFTDEIREFNRKYRIEY